METGAVHICGGKTRAVDPLELELQAVGSCCVWVLETEFRFSGKACGAFN